MISAIIGWIFIDAVELAIPTEIRTKKGKAAIETHPVTVEAKIRKCSV